nr:hypothetical protein CFP56_25261 [Quercus suber]
MHLCSGCLVTSSEEQSNSKSESTSKSQSSPQSCLNMDPPPQDELREAIAELTARLGHLEAREWSDMVDCGRRLLSFCSVRELWLYTYIRSHIPVRYWIQTDCI